MSPPKMLALNSRSSSGGNRETIRAEGQEQRGSGEIPAFRTNVPESPFAPIYKQHTCADNSSRVL
jgi:hypothetical protein